MKVLSVCVLAFFACCLSCGAGASQKGVAALRRALASSASWTMERRMGDSSRVFVSTGTVSCAVGEGIAWRVLHPFLSSVVMTTNSMVFTDEEGSRARPLDNLPHYGEIQKRTDAFARGDASAFEGLFSLEQIDLPDGTWQLTMVPEMSALRRLFASVRISGDALPREAVMTNGDGSVTRIRFREIAR